MASPTVALTTAACPINHDPGTGVKRPGQREQPDHDNQAGQYRQHVHSRIERPVLHESSTPLQRPRPGYPREAAAI